MNEPTFLRSDKVMLIIPFRRSAAKWMKPVPRIGRVYCVKEVCKTTDGNQGLVLVGVTAKASEDGKERVFASYAFRLVAPRQKEEA